MFFFYVKPCFIDNKKQREYDIHIENNQMFKTRNSLIFSIIYHATVIQITILLSEEA